MDKLVMTAGVMGSLPKEAMINQPEIVKALERGAILGAYMLSDIVYENGIGAWELIEDENV